MDARGALRWEGQATKVVEGRLLQDRIIVSPSNTMGMNDQLKAHTKNDSALLFFFLSTKGLPDQLFKDVPSHILTPEVRAYVDDKPSV